MPLLQYLLASYNSNATLEQVKEKNCITWKIGSIVNDKFKYSNLILTNRALAKQQIRSMRPTDPELDNVLEKV